MKTYKSQIFKLEMIMTIGIIRIVTDLDFESIGIDRQHAIVYGFFPHDKNGDFEQVFQGVCLSRFITNIYNMMF